VAQATSSTAANQSGAARATRRNKIPPVSAPTSIARTEISRRPRADLGRGVGDQTGDGQDEHRRGQVGYGQPAYDGVLAAHSHTIDPDRSCWRNQQKRPGRWPGRNQ
jgi:hypothetical protein